jgi:hypothetical protein
VAKIARCLVGWSTIERGQQGLAGRSKFNGAWCGGICGVDGCVWGISYRGGGMGNKSWDKVELEGVMRCGRLQGGVPH